MLKITDHFYNLVEGRCSVFQAWCGCLHDAFAYIFIAYVVGQDRFKPEIIFNKFNKFA